MNYGVEIFGVRWSLLIIRDIVFVGKKTYGQFLQSERESRLEEQGILSKAPGPDDRRKDFYTLPETALDLIPIVLNIGARSTNSKSYIRDLEKFVTRLVEAPRR